MKTSSTLTIVEGPDGAGKSTLVREIARATGAYVVHHGPYPGVSEGLERLYAESILPAVLGHSDVVLDRCWLSERPYGTVFRNGSDRLGVAAVRSLERLALRCRTVVVRALPPKDVAMSNFISRKGNKAGAEMLDGAEQFTKVYDLYTESLRTSLSIVHYDYMTDADIVVRLIGDPGASWGRAVHSFMSAPHPLSWATAGSLEARVALVADSFPDHRNADALYRWPFSSIRSGPAKSLALRLERGGIPEYSLFWVNADALTPEITGFIASKEMKIVALGSTAASILKNYHIEPSFIVIHPNACSKFKASDPEDYELIPYLKEVLS